MHRKPCGDKQALLKLSDAKAIRLAYGIGSVKENFTQKNENHLLTLMYFKPKHKKTFVFVHTKKVSVD